MTYYIKNKEICYKLLETIEISPSLERYKFLEVSLKKNNRKSNSTNCFFNYSKVILIKIYFVSEKFVNETESIITLRNDGIRNNH